MQVTVVAEPSIEESLKTRVTADIRRALQSIVTAGRKFVVNDSLWYMRTRGGEIGPSVVNSASFLSSKFQAALGSLAAWRGETKIEKQRIDGYGAFAMAGNAFHLPRERLFGFLQQYAAEQLPADTDLGALATRIYGMYVNRSLFDLATIPRSLHHYFDRVPTAGQLRIGVEFETGNISSSFRALTKLGNLFSWGKIDAGVFVTGIDKPTCATRIWPVTNRNGSFQELRQRHYKANLTLPLWEVAFAPDAFDRNAPYLGSKGQLYMPRNTGARITMAGSKYSVWRGEKGEELFRPETIGRKPAAPPAMNRRPGAVPSRTSHAMTARGSRVSRR